MNNTNITSLTPELHHRILITVCEHSPKDLASAIIAYRGLNYAWHGEQFYRTVDLIAMNKRDLTGEGRDVLYEICFEARKPSVVYLRGFHDFFRLHLLNEGLEKMEYAAHRGCLVAKYASTMIKIVLSVDSEGYMPQLPQMTHDFSICMRELIKLKLEFVYSYEEPLFWLKARKRVAMRCGGCTGTNHLLCPYPSIATTASGMWS